MLDLFSEVLFWEGWSLIVIWSSINIITLGSWFLSMSYNILTPTSAVSKYGVSKVGNSSNRNLGRKRLSKLWSKKVFNIEVESELVDELFTWELLKEHNFSLQPQHFLGKMVSIQVEGKEWPQENEGKIWPWLHLLMLLEIVSEHCSFFQG